MTRPDLEALALRHVARHLSLPPDRVDSGHWVTANTADLAAFAATIDAAAVARWVRRIREMAEQVSLAHERVVLTDLADELEAET